MLDWGGKDYVPGCLGFVTNGLRQNGRTALLRQRDSSHCLAPRIPWPVELLSCNNSRRWLDLETYPAHPHFTSVRTSPDKAGGIAYSQSDVADGQRSTRRPKKPALQQFGVGKCFEDALSWSREDAPKRDLAFRWSCQFEGSGIAVALQPCGRVFKWPGYKASRSALCVSSLGDQSSPLQDF